MAALVTTFGYSMNKQAINLICSLPGGLFEELGFFFPFFSDILLRVMTYDLTCRGVEEKAHFKNCDFT